jgi:hypothetical protein
MDRRVVDGNDQIHSRHLSGETIHIAQRIDGVVMQDLDTETLANGGEIGGAVAILQIDEPHPRLAEQWRPEVECGAPGRPNSRLPLRHEIPTTSGLP